MGLPIVTPFFSAKFLPTTHSSAPAVNHDPSMRHQGFVCLNPVTKVPPVGSETACSDHAPIKTASPLPDGLTKVAEAGEKRGVQDATLASRIGLKATMLLCQKMVLSFGRSASGRYAPEFTGR